uniref:Uncharacterized protein n=1 Tax=Xiphophorus couchianus TaxID=32473 RepID=A0A3B5L7W1_9TELE
MQHLLCINLLVLVLLPSSLSCDSKAELVAVRDHFIGFVQTHMDNIVSMNELFTKDPSVRSQRRRIPRNPGKKQMKKLCKAKAILSSMTVCYQRLNIYPN